MERMSRISAIIVMAFTLATVGCGDKKARAPESVMDSPAHHYTVGERLLARGEIAEAEREFELAKQLEPEFAPAYAGIGIVQAKQDNFEAAEASVEKAIDLADDDEEEVIAHAAMIRVLTEWQREDWLKDAERHFEKAVDAEDEIAAPYYYMGNAYKAAFEFNKASEKFAKVLEMNQEFVSEAERQWRIVQDIQRASPGSKIAKEIALQDILTRADAAALFIEELNLPKLYKQRTPTDRQFDTSFKVPGGTGQTDAKGEMAVAEDVQEHPLRADIMETLKIGIRGLEVGPDGNFEPSQPVTRAEFSMMVEDILIKITGDEGLATKFIGDTSPFPDVRPDMPYYNAIRVVESRQILGPKNNATGEFAPNEPITGAQALLAIRNLKDMLRF